MTDVATDHRVPEPSRGSDLPAAVFREPAASRRRLRSSRAIVIDLRHGARHFENLMHAAQKGDAGAYERLLKEIVLLLRNAVRRRRPFLDTADVEDLVQETLISVHAARASYDARRPFLPWLYALLGNRMADAARSHARRAAREVQTEDFERTFESVPDGDDGQHYGDPQLLMQAIRELPDGQRKAVELLKLQELSLKAASAATGMSIGALKIAMHRALLSLRGRLGHARRQPRS